MGVVAIGLALPQFPGEPRQGTPRQFPGEPRSTTDCPNKVESWHGDKYCDDFMNTPDCGFDGGDCCQDQPNSGWNSYCKVMILTVK